MFRRGLIVAGRRLGGADLATPALATQTREYAKGRIRGRRGAVRGAPPPAEDPWEEVRDESTGQTYWWNVQTNETTALGAPKPQPGAPPPAGVHQGSNAVARPGGGGSLLGGFGSMVAEGMAFGTGSAIAHRAIGSMFGGGGYYGGGGGGGAAPPPEQPAAPPADAGGGSFWGDEMDDIDDDGGGGGFFDGFDFDGE